jgi:ribonuclease HI
MYFNNSKMINGSGASMVLESPKGDLFRYVLQIHFMDTNNVPEYEALLHGLRMAKEIGITRIVCYGNSELVVSQCNGMFDIVDPNMAAYKQAVDLIGAHFLPLSSNTSTGGSTRRQTPYHESDLHKLRFLLAFFLSISINLLFR